MLNFYLLVRHSLGESVDIDHAAAMDAAGGDFHAIMGVDLKRDGRTGDVNHPRTAFYRESFRRGGEMFDFDFVNDRPATSL